MWGSCSGPYAAVGFTRAPGQGAEASMGPASRAVTAGAAPSNTPTQRVSQALGDSGEQDRQSPSFTDLVAHWPGREKI